ncbi:MAG: Fic family protein [Solirubrobacteraceae bacterium]
MEAHVYRTPTLDPIENEVLRLIDDLREDLRHRVAQPRRWIGTLRKMAFARAVQGSNSIEGYNASLDDVAAAVEDEPTLDANQETQLALAGYRDAMTYVLQIADDKDATIDEGMIKALHFMMLRHDLAKSPGRWRPGYIGVRDEGTGEIVYEGPSADSIPGLIDSMLQVLSEDTPTLVKAAMAHLNLVMIHPFRDGNGRMARCLQTLVIARGRIDAPVLSSVEEYLGRNTRSYYDALAEVGQGAWHPDNNARPWIRFMLTAHYRQAKTHLRRIQEIERLYSECSELASRQSLSDRCAAGLSEVALGLRLRRTSYMSVVKTSTGEEISELTATRDLQAMVRAGLLTPRGETRGRYYVAAPSTSGLQEAIRASRPPQNEYDPFVLAAKELQLSLNAS